MRRVRCRRRRRSIRSSSRRTCISYIIARHRTSRTPSASSRLGLLGLGFFLTFFSLVLYASLSSESFTFFRLQTCAGESQSHRQEDVLSLFADDTAAAAICAQSGQNQTFGTMRRRARQKCSASRGRSAASPPIRAECNTRLRRGPQLGPAQIRRNFTTPSRPNSRACFHTAAQRLRTCTAETYAHVHAKVRVVRVFADFLMPTYDHAGVLRLC